MGRGYHAILGFYALAVAVKRLLVGVVGKELVETFGLLNGLLGESTPITTKQDN
jgi:hypothetical protein